MKLGRHKSTFIGIRLGMCNKCGALSHVGRELQEEERVGDAPVSRCALIYELDSGDETCGGDVFYVGGIDAKVTHLYRNNGDA